jgi:hypothetical protein
MWPAWYRSEIHTLFLVGSPKEGGRLEGLDLEEWKILKLILEELDWRAWAGLTL